MNNTPSTARSDMMNVDAPKSPIPSNVKYTGKILRGEAFIRAEIARLDKKTGLHGAEVPITFSNAKRTLGQFGAILGEPERLYFRFSHHWYQNPEWTDEMALDTIRHEYAHYMDWVLYRGRGHGKTWKACCMKVGAAPVRLYSREDNDRIVQLHKEEESLTNRLARYRAGQLISHPRFGKGFIREIIGEGRCLSAQIEFYSVGHKRLSLQWLDENCRLIA